jgi:uncharacterized membrane protein YcaP (DUF421 family)
MPDIVDLGSSLPEIVLRTGIVYLFLVAAIRLSGKREVGQISVPELVVILIISNAVQNAMVGQNTSVAAGIVAVLTLLILDRVLDFLIDRSKRFRHMVEGEPRLLVRDGRMLTRALHEAKVRPDDLRAAVRNAGIASVDDVRLAVLETDGSISVIPMANPLDGGLLR